MSAKKDKTNVEVHILTEKTTMKFIPTNFAQIAPPAADKAKPSSPVQPDDQKPKVTSRFSLTNLFRRGKSK